MTIWYQTRRGRQARLGPNANKRHSWHPAGGSQLNLNPDKTSTSFTLTKPGGHFSTARSIASYQRAASDMNLHHAPSLSMLPTPHMYSNTRAGMSMDYGLEQLHSMAPSPPNGHYAHSELLTRADLPDETQNNQFLSSKRHHAQYFSNLDLFTQGDGGYNYLRYAKADEMRPVISKQPHLAIKNISFEHDKRTDFDRKMLRTPNYVRTLDGVSMEAYGGETIAIMYTNEDEVKTLLGLIANRNTKAGNPDGSFSLNGVAMGSQSLGERVAYVTDDDMYPNLTVKQHLQLASAFLKPATHAFKASHMVSQLIQTLALAPFHDRMLCELGYTEKQRVKIACQILLDTDIIILDNIVKYMDLYDAAFVIDYLRDWATKLNRIVIMAINPPTFEILSMFYKSAILASGRLVYFGRAQQMLGYFEALEYPCPLFKNPCDYYVDLVTRDHLTIEATIESTERIRRLADTWAQRQPIISDQPNLPIAPPKVNRVDVFTAVRRLVSRFYSLLLNQPGTYLGEIWLSVLLSLILGIIYFHSTMKKQAGINDRMHIFYTLLTLFLIPNLCLNIQMVHNDRRLLYPDRKRRLYSAVIFFIAKTMFDLPIALVSYVVYAVPVYFLCGLQPLAIDNGITFGLYVGMLVLYCYAMRMTAWCMAHAFYNKYTALLWTGVLLLLISVSSGITLHPIHHWDVVHWIRVVSPVQWSQQVLIGDEFFGNSTRRMNQAYDGTGSMLYAKQTVRTLRVLPGTAQNVPILLTNDIESSGAQNYAFANLTLPEVWQYRNDPGLLRSIAFGAVGIWALVALLLNCCLIQCCNHKPPPKKVHRE